MGKPAFFIRLYGCPLKCGFCDSAGTWHPDYHVPEDIGHLPVDFLVREVLNAAARMVIITGGEPAIHDLTELVFALNKRNIQVHIETSGAFPIKGKVDWITCSPKKAKPPLPEVVRIADEFKFIIEEPGDIPFYYGTLLNAGATEKHLQEDIPIWLHPEWSQRENPKVLQAICSAVKELKGFRAGWQVHKLYKVDNLDPRARPPVPLGGNPEKGY